MKETEFEAMIPDYVLNKLMPKEREAFERYLESHPDAQDKLAEWKSMTAFMQEDLAEPSPSMDDTFFTMLAKEKEELERPKVSWLRNLFINQIGTHRRWTPLAFGTVACIILLAGFFIGKGFNTEQEVENSSDLVNLEAIEAAENETDAVRSELFISLADQPSASKRLEGLSEVNKLDNATDKVIVALFKLLNTDPNVNVRLAAVTSLSKYVENPKVREGLVMSITQQESPLVQIALAELMVTLKEQKSINSMETLLQRPDINDAVRQKLEESIKEII